MMDDEEKIRMFKQTLLMVAEKMGFTLEDLEEYYRTSNKSKPLGQD